MLRGAMKLEQIASLMEYINGDVEDTSDDIIDEIQLYNILCRIIFAAEDEIAFRPEAVRTLISRELADCADQVRLNEKKLRDSMYVMVMAYRSGVLKAEMEKGLKKIFDGE